MLLIRQTGGSREPWGHSSWCLGSATIKTYVSFIPMPAPSLCHIPGPPDFRRELNHSSDCGSGTKCRTTPGRGEGIWARDKTVQHFLHIILCHANVCCAQCERGTREGCDSVWHRTGKKAKNCYPGKGQQANKSSPSWLFVCVSRPHWGHS